MRILTNNQWRCDVNQPAWEAIGEDCSCPVRAAKLVKVYSSLCPDVLCFQETSEMMALTLQNALAEVDTPNGTARYQMISGGDTPIFYRWDKYEVKESGFFRYDTAVPGLVGEFNNQGTKSYTYAVLTERESGKVFAVLSTHLWWMSSAKYPGSAEARAYQIGVAADAMDRLIEKYHCPGFIMGDLNSGIGSKCLGTAFARGYAEVHDLAPEGHRDETCGYHYCYASGIRPYEGEPFSYAIDHILLKNGGSVRVTNFARYMDPFFDTISDHYPAYIDVEY